MAIPIHEVANVSLSSHPVTKQERLLEGGRSRGIGGAETNEPFCQGRWFFFSLFSPERGRVC